MEKRLKTGLKTKISKTGKVDIIQPKLKFKHVPTGICFYSSKYYPLKQGVYHIEDNKHFRTAKLINS